MNAKPLPWFRAYTDMVDDEKLRLLAFEDRWHFIALLCCKGSGLLDSGDAPALLRRKIAVKLGLAARELEEAARRLEEVGLIDAETFQPVAWDARQFNSDSSTQRVKAYRERMKRAGNVSVTAQDTDTDTDTDTEATAKADAPPAARGHRLPVDWTPTQAQVDFATDRIGAATADEIDKFRDHWKAAPGSKGVKLDWDATFRNWIRTAAKPRNGHANVVRLSAAERVRAHAIEGERADERASAGAHGRAHVVGSHG